MKSYRKGLRWILGTLLSLGLPAWSGAQDIHGSGTSELARPDWGTRDRILSHIPYSDFLPLGSFSGYSSRAGGPIGRYATATTAIDDRLFAVARVPSGALLTYLELDYCDDIGTVEIGDVYLFAEDCNLNGTDCQDLGAIVSSAGPMGCSYLGKDLTGLNHTVDNNRRRLVLIADTQRHDGRTQINGAYIGYKLQLSVAPMSPTFGDVPTNHTYYRAIEALASSGITGGCGNGNFCPSQNVTRGEMAAFLARALGAHFQN